MNKPLEVQAETADRLSTLAQASGLSVDEFLRTILESVSAPPSHVAVSDDERHAANRRLRQHIVSLGYPTGIDNESIDADLAREYGSTHEKE